MHTVGIIGCGGISESHYRGFHDTGRAHVDCVYDVDPEAAREKALVWKARVVPSAEDLVDAGVDIVVIATPGFAHREYVEMAAAAGKHILCEKPLALNLEDAQAIRRAVADAGVVFTCNFTQRHKPEFVQLREVQQSGRLGGVVSAWAALHAPASSGRWRHIQQSGHWRASMELSGGRISEFCSHTINWLLWVLGRPKSVYGKALFVTEGFALDDADYAIIDCEDGVGLLDVHRHAGIARDTRYGIQGHAGSVILRDGRVFLTPMDAETVEVPIERDVPSRHETFLRAVEDHRVDLRDLDDAIDTLRVCLAFNRSTASGRVETV
ncbi:MAG TPA: Gfo/Idh/MocA family oxidoreductase [Planctomycetota bacterium]|nr:Gfo/Idh/MocA family oxidoreductase [Planctomycetota bacterium]